MRQTLLVPLALLMVVAGCQMFDPKPAAPVAPPPLKVKATAPVNPNDVTKANAQSMARRLSEECDRDAEGEFNP
jgi:predicted component of type VI protein secretion system